MWSARLAPVVCCVLPLVFVFAFEPSDFWGKKTPVAVLPRSHWKLSQDKRIARKRATKQIKAGRESRLQRWRDVLTRGGCEKTLERRLSEEDLKQFVRRAAVSRCLLFSAMFMAR